MYKKVNILNVWNEVIRKESMAGKPRGHQLPTSAGYGVHMGF